MALKTIKAKDEKIIDLKAKYEADLKSKNYEKSLIIFGNAVAINCLGAGRGYYYAYQWSTASYGNLFY